MRTRDSLPSLFRRFTQDRRAFTGAEKALLICAALAVVMLVFNLVGQGSRQAARDARRVLEENPLATGGFAPVGQIPGVAQVGSPEEIAKAQADQFLKGNLEIIPPNTTGQVAPNQLTQAQYDQLVKLFADITLGKTDIRFDKNDVAADPKFRDAVMKDFALLAQTKSGRDLLQKMADNPNGNTLTVRVNRDTQGRPDTSNAYADALDPRERAKWADGRGVHTVISYVPGTDVQIPGGTSSWLPLRGDIVLFHELAHAMHISRGTMDNSIVQINEGASPLDVQSRIRNSEYQAVGLGKYTNDPITENRYRSERNNLKGRKGAIKGDGSHKRRDEYVVRTAPAAPPP